ncbi:MAG TPA: hypothetical protein VHN78_12675 [Chloroflexota bacterium]|nr:hypothetical protein [Chloroflexota bacterium]
MSAVLETNAPAARVRLPWQLRAARAGEALFLPAGLLMWMAQPLDQPAALVVVGLQIVVAAAAFVGLGRRSRLAWGAALLLAAFFIQKILRHGFVLVEQVLATGSREHQIGLALAAWVLVTQAVVLVGCLAMLPGRYGDLR